MRDWLFRKQGVERAAPTELAVTSMIILYKHIAPTELL